MLEYPTGNVMSTDHDGMRERSGRKHAELTLSECPSSVDNLAHVLESHTRTVMSQDPDAMRAPSELKHTDRIT